MAADSTGYKNSSQYLLQYFQFEHLSDRLKVVSEPFCQLAMSVWMMGGDQRETEACLRKLLEAKDCAMRAML